MYTKKIVFISLVFASLLQAQMVGNPAGVKGEGEWTLSATGIYINQRIGNEMAISRRVLLKSIWGLMPW